MFLDRVLHSTGMAAAISSSCARNRADETPGLCAWNAARRVLTQKPPTAWRRFLFFGAVFMYAASHVGFQCTAETNGGSAWMMC